MSRKKLQEIALFYGIGLRVRKLRGNLTQEHFADGLGVHKSTVSRIESGKLFPDAELRRKIAEFGNVSDEWLLRGDQAPAPAAAEHAPEGYSATLSDIETSLLIAAALKSEEVIKARRVNLTLEQKIRLYVKVYDDCRAAHERPSTVHVERALLLRD